MTNAELFKKVFGLEVNPESDVCMILSCKACGRRGNACEYAFEDFWNQEYEATQQDDYEQGLNDAWECAKKVMMFDGYSTRQLGIIFGTNSLREITSKPPQEVIAKLKEYEEETEQRMNEHRKMIKEYIAKYGRDAFDELVASIEDGDDNVSS